MKQVLAILFLIAGVVLGGFLMVKANQAIRFSDTEFETLGGPISEEPDSIYELYANWQRPAGPLRVGLQVGHWKNNELPADEFERLIGNTGAKGGGTTEVAVNQAIAEATAKLLAEKDIVVDILPATVPVQYWADVFVAIHADGSPDSSINGFKVAAPYSRRDLTGKGAQLEEIFTKNYQAVTNMPIDPNVTRNMRGYYAFNWRRHQHAIHPMTPAIIVETGFLTSPVDQRILINNPAIAAEGIANSILEFLEIE